MLQILTPILPHTDAELTITTDTRHGLWTPGPCARPRTDACFIARTSQTATHFMSRRHAASSPPYIDPPPVHGPELS